MRVDWVDYGKGFCIIMVVMMHSTLGVEAALGQQGWMHDWVAFASPFRMPDFFLIAGLFLSRTVDRPWREFADTKVLHFAYFYVLWVTIQLAIKAPHFADTLGWPGVAWLYLESFWEPFGTLWFIYALPVFLVVTKLTRRTGIPPLAVWLFAAALEIAHIETDSTLALEFARRFVFFYSGYIAAPYVFRLAATVQARPLGAIGALLTWASLNGLLVLHGYDDWPLISLALGFLGAGAVVSVSALLAKADLLAPLRYIGEHSLIVYLAFFLPMAATRAVLVKSGVIADVGTMALIITIAGVVGPLLLYWATRNTFARFLFVRPTMFRLGPRREATLQPAE